MTEPEPGTQTLILSPEDQARMAGVQVSSPQTGWTKDEIVDRLRQADELLGLSDEQRVNIAELLFGPPPSRGL